MIFLAMLYCAWDQSYPMKEPRLWFLPGKNGQTGMRDTAHPDSRGKSLRQSHGVRN